MVTGSGKLEVILGKGLDVEKTKFFRKVQAWGVVGGAKPGETRDGELGVQKHLGQGLLHIPLIPVVLHNPNAYVPEVGISVGILV